MKKFYIISILLAMTFCALAQTNQNLSKAKGEIFSANKIALGNLKVGFSNNSNSIFNSTNSLTSIPMGTSANIYTCLHGVQRYLSYNPDLNIITFVHRLGGAWGGTSGEIRVKYSSNFFSTKDSIQYTLSAPGLFRYPSNIVYNPTGNTNPVNAYSLVGGPSTGGAGWINNYFGSKTLGGANSDLQLIEVPSDTTKMMYSGFTGGNGRYHSLAHVTTTTTTLLRIIPLQ